MSLRGRTLFFSAVAVYNNHRGGRYLEKRERNGGVSFLSKLFVKPIPPFSVLSQRMADMIVIVSLIACESLIQKRRKIPRQYDTTLLLHILWNIQFFLMGSEL